MPRTIGELAAKGLEPGGWLRVILDAGAAPGELRRASEAMERLVGESDEAALKLKQLSQ